MKKILILISLLIFILMFTGCNNADEPNEQIPYVPYTPEEVIPVVEEYARQPEHAYVTPEMLVGTWVLHSQETETELMERAVIFDSGVKLLFNSDGDAFPFFWRLDDNVLSSHLFYLTRGSIDMNIMINADGALVFTYEDGLTGTYIRSDDEMPERVVNPEFAGLWHFYTQMGDGEFPDSIDFFPDGFGMSHCPANGVRVFQWDAAEDVLLFKNIDGEYSVFIIYEMGFLSDWDSYIFIMYRYDKTHAIYYRPAETRLRGTPSLHGGTLYEIVSPANLTRFQYSSRYTFEQFFLPSVIFDLEGAVIHMLQTGDLRDMSELVHEAWAHQMLVYIPMEEMIAMVQDSPDAFLRIMEAFEAAVDGMQLLADLFLDITGLGDGHIVDVTFEELDENTNAFIIEMKHVQAGWLSTFIGIAYNEWNGLFMFTLERAHVPAGTEPFYVFCILHVYFRGSFFPIENSREAFARHIGYAMDGALGSPGHTTERELWDLRAIFG